MTAEVEQIARSLDTKQTEALRMAGFMLSGKWRIPFTHGGHVAAYTLIDAGLIDRGGYTTPLGEQVRQHLLEASSEHK